MRRHIGLSITALLLAALLLFSGCGKIETAAPADEAEQTGLHDETTHETTDEEETDMTQPVEKFSAKQVFFGAERKYRVAVLAKAGSEVDYAVSELSKYLIKMRILVKSDGYPITIGIDERRAADSYRIKVTADGVTIDGGNLRGAVYGAYRFLEEFCGVRFFTPTLETCKEGDVVLSPCEIEYTPRFAKRSFDWYDARLSQAWMVKNYINDCGFTGPFAAEMGGSWNAGGVGVHSLGRLTETGDGTTTNPCLTDPAILQTVIRNVRAILERDPNVNSISVSQNDTPEHCECENCRRIAEEEGNWAGVMLRFVNAVAEDIAADYPNVTIDTLAYQWTVEPPRVTRPRDNVSVWLCPITCDYTHPLSEGLCPENAAFDGILTGWADICDNLQIWDYTNNYRYSIPTYANLMVLWDNMHYYAENSVRSMFPEGNYYSASGEFGELRAYLLARLMRDPNMNRHEYVALMDEFLEAYYGGGWRYIRAYIDALCGQAASGCQNIFEPPFAAISEDYFRAMEETFDDWWNRAETMAGDRRAFVVRSRLQWRYIKLMLHPDAAVAAAFVADVTAAGVWWKEGSRDLPEDVDLSLPPDRWFTFTWWI